jgi:hypothetical protein
MRRTDLFDVGKQCIVARPGRCFHRRRLVQASLGFLGTIRLHWLCSMARTTDAQNVAGNGSQLDVASSK